LRSERVRNARAWVSAKKEKAEENQRTGFGCRSSRRIWQGATRIREALGCAPVAVLKAEESKAPDRAGACRPLVRLSVIGGVHSFVVCS